ncbi:hypothetical protein J2744_002152 [Halorubrum trapanicum]|uniref:Uncharacterized protein n=1 Tax=Halorubrum trapanicum TaxID=29284 RepID=A0A8J7UP57_9EURY|nr:hypothetical protein [Halorubrum trapanicum]
MAPFTVAGFAVIAFGFGLLKRREIADAAAGIRFPG